MKLIALAIFQRKQTACLKHLERNSSRIKRYFPVTINIIRIPCRVSYSLLPFPVIWRRCSPYFFPKKNGIALRQICFLINPTKLTTETILAPGTKDILRIVAKCFSAPVKRQGGARYNACLSSSGSKQLQP